MALIKMELYDDLQKNMRDAHESGTVYKVQLKKIKKDLKKRKTGRIARIVILSICAVALLIMVGMCAGIIGPNSASTDPNYKPEPLMRWGSLLEMWFVPATWLLCFVGFPIGWNWTKDDRENAKSQLYVQHTVDEYGNVDTYASTAPARIGAFFFSLLQGCLTMIASIPIAIVQCFTWKKQIARIQGIVNEIEANPDLFVAE